MRIKIFIGILIGILIVYIFSLFYLPSVIEKLLPSKIEKKENITEEKIEELKPPALETPKREESLPGPLKIKEQKEVLPKEVYLSEEEIIKFTNRYRQDYGVKELKVNEILNNAAKVKLNDMFEKQYFAHISPEGKGAADIIAGLGYEYLSVGENLALGNFKNSKELVDGWMTCPGHRANILNPKFKEIGVGVKKDIFEGKETYLAVQIFATPVSECPLPDPNLLTQIELLEQNFENLKKEVAGLEKEIEELQKTAQSLYLEGQKLVKEGGNFIEEGNKLIEKGNEIYSTTGDSKEAEKYWQEGKTLQEKGKEKIDQGLAKNAEIEKIQAKIDEKSKEYDDLIQKINNLYQELKNLISKYNLEVVSFNQCISQ